MHAIIRLPCPQCRCKSTFPCIRHDINHSFQCFVPVRGKSKEQGMLTFFHGMDAQKWGPHTINGEFHVSTTIMQFVVASAAEADLGALYHNCQTGIFFRLTLAEMGHPQPQTPVHCNNATVVGIANNTIKRQRSQSMDMRFSGWEIKLHRKCTNSDGTQVKRTWPITRVNTMLCQITSMYTHGIYIWRILQDFH
jgi:hypothetical protein